MPTRASKAALCSVLVLCAAGCARRADEAGPFRDVTAESGLDFVHFNGMTGELYFSEIVGSGAALLDYDEDGDLDVFLVQGALQGRGKTIADALFPPRHDPPFADRLYRNDQGAGLPVRLVDVTGSLPLRHDGYGMGVAAGDVDNDGDLDLYLTSLGANHLWVNRGDGSFEDDPEAGVDDPRWSTSASFADFDRDGLLDLFVVNYVDYRPDLGKECHAPDGSPDYCGPLAYAPETARLLHNLGRVRFSDETLDARIHTASGNGLGIVTADFDADGWTDVYVANDLMANFLWLNRGDGTFVDEGLGAARPSPSTGRPRPAWACWPRTSMPTATSICS
ncbi:MAG: VCBS repeat-containing protein [Thermoanaerobaculia bacterium]